MYRLIDEYNNSNGQRGLLNTTEARNAYLREAEMRNTDWFDVLFTNAVSQNHSVSITAGTEKSSFYASLSAMLDPGWYKQSKVKRYTANVNTTYNIYKNLSLNLISNASYRQQNAPGTMNSTLDIASGKMSRGFDINPYSYALNTSRTLDPSVDYISNYAPFNILHELDNNYIEINMVDVKFQGEMKWKVVQGLELSALGAGSICGGGRYDDLTGIFGMPNMSGVGISFGADRIYDVMTGLSLFPEEVNSSTRVLFVNLGAEEEAAVLPLLRQLRGREIAAEIYPEAGKMKKQMEYANRRGIPYVVIVGSQELEAGAATVKDMRTGEQRQVLLDKLATEICNS